MEQKFRYYDPFNDCFTYSDIFYENYLSYNYRALAEFFDDLARCDECENNPVFELYSTVDDIKKNEIYTGDIVKVAHDEIGSEIPGGFSGDVRFMESGFFVCNDDLELAFPVWQEIAQWEIIGDIHHSKNV